MTMSNANAAVTHIGWPLKATHKPKPAKECACPTRKKKFSKMPHEQQKRKREKKYFKMALEKAATKTRGAKPNCAMGLFILSALARHRAKTCQNIC